MASLESLHDLLILQLKDLYNVETQLLDALPVMARASTAPELRSAFEEHLEQTKEHRARLDRLFGGLEEDPTGETCQSMESLIDEAEEALEHDADPVVLDAALIVAAQQIEHYEIAGYGSVRTFARVLGYDEVAKLLQQTLDEEEATDDRLTQIAERLNVAAEAADEADV
jgi:ferritin-like metal-binding protein YciE